MVFTVGGQTALSEADTYTRVLINWFILQMPALIGVLGVQEL